MQQYAYGFNLELDLGVDLTDATVVEAIIQKPDGTPVTRSATIHDRPNGIVYLPVEQGDFDQLGPYHLQAVDATPGRLVYSDVVTLLVKQNLAPPPTP